MPDFTSEVEVTPWEFIDSCSSHEIKELIEELIDGGHLERYNGKVEPSKETRTVMDMEWEEDINKNTHYVDFSNPNADKISSASTTIIKQETLEEVAQKYFNDFGKRFAFIKGAKWQEQQTIEEVFEWLTTNNYLTDLKETLIENFKNK